uniref:Anoctamin n=1 Tax=Plectus sambesii TaxID=2011161 RepID=A0A914W972_9BILA
MKRSCMTIAWSRARRFVSSGRRSRRALSSFRRFRRSTMSNTTLQESSMTPRDNQEDVLRPTFSAPPQSFPRIDYVLVYDHRDVAHDARRNIFHQRIRRLGLQIDIEQVGNHSFVKIFCPFDRLCYEAEKMGLEMPLKGCEIRELESSGFLAWIWKYFVTDNEVDFVSGPFATDKLYLFEGFENELTLFRSGLRSLLVHNLLMEPLPDTSFSPTAWGDSSPATSLRRLATTQSVRSRANKDFDPEHDYNLPRLLLQGIYKDSFVMHDRSVDDPSYTKLKDRDPEQHATLMKRLQKFHDPRRELNETWTKLFKFQPLWKIRNYFGEKIALYCAWMGLLISFLWIPSIAGVAVYGNALYQVIQNHTIQTCKCYASNQTLSDGSRQCGEEKTVSDYIALDIVGVLRRSFIHFGSANALFSFAICVWAALFTEFWKRKNNTLAYRWDCNKWEATEQDRPEFVGTETQLDPIAKEMIPIYPESKRILRYFVSFLVVLLM